MKKFILVFIIFGFCACKQEAEEKSIAAETIEAVQPVLESEKITLTKEYAEKLVDLPLSCISKEYPNKLGQVLANKEEMAEPSELHPAFYGCFDWHSAVHAHWSLVNLLKHFPDLKNSEAIREKLKESLSKENILGEVAYFNRKSSEGYERTYGWAWILKLAEELHTWEDPLARELEENLQPLTQLVENKYMKFLPKMNYPVRAGEHENTAFALVFAHDYATAVKNEELRKLVENRATHYYLADKDCPLDYEPSGYDFLSPCFEEVDIMRRVLPETAFEMWMKDFLPQLANKDFALEPVEVTDRADGKLIHLEGLNLSRAWVMHGLANQYPEKYGHLKNLANEKIAKALPQVLKDQYEGKHWLGSFALYTLNQTE